MQNGVTIITKASPKLQEQNLRKKNSSIMKDIEGKGKKNPQSKVANLYFAYIHTKLKAKLSKRETRRRKKNPISMKVDNTCL